MIKKVCSLIIIFTIFMISLSVAVDTTTTTDTSTTTTITTTTTSTDTTTTTIPLPTKYTITATAGPNGKIRPKGKIVIKAGGGKSFTAIPKNNTYYPIINLNGQTVKIGNPGKQLVYKLKNVSSNGIIEAQFIKKKKTFADSVSITITGLGESIKVTNTTPATFVGVAQSDAGISVVKYFNDTNGKSGKATGTTEWSASIILQEGDNKLRFLAIADDNSENEISTIVTYYPSLDFTTPLSFFKTSQVYNSETGKYETLKESISALYVNDSTNVIFVIGLGNTTDAVVKLYQTDANGENPVELGEMKDDGVSPDEIQGDGNFTISQSLSPTEEGFLYYRVGVTKGETTYSSETISIWVTSHFTSEQVDNAVSIADSAEEIFNDAIANKKNFKQAAEEVKNTLKDDLSIGAVNTTGTGGVWWVTNDGILGLYHPTKAGQRSGSSRSGEKSSQVSSATPTKGTNSDVKYYPPEYLQDRSKYAPSYWSKLTGIGKSAKFSIAAAEKKDQIKSTKGILISPYINNPNTTANFGNTDDYYGPWQAIKDKKSCALYATKEVVNNGSINVSVDTFKNLSDYGYIHVSTHGDNYFEGLLGIWKEAWGPNDFLKGALSQVVILTGVKVPKKEDGTFDITGYEADIKAKRIAISPSGTVSLLPKFFSDYIGSLPNSLVVLGACRSMYNNSMANVFLSKGAGAVIGFSDYVNSAYARNTTTKIINDMFDDKTVSQGVANAISTYGASDADADPAYLYYTGNANLVLSSGELENAGFEDGVLTPWVSAGDGRIITQLGGTSPTEGSFMGIISTGLGYTTSSGSIEQEFCSSSKLSTISFDWNFFSEEFIEYCNSQYQDAFVVKISVYDDATATWGAEDVLFSRNVDSLCGSVSQSDVSFDRGGVYNTGWMINEVLDVSAYAGKHLKIKFYATDIGDSIYDTAILFDNITITDAP